MSVCTERSGQLEEAREGWVEGRKVMGAADNLSRAACLLFMVSMSMSTSKEKPFSVRRREED